MVAGVALAVTVFNRASASSLGGVTLAIFPEFPLGLCDLPTIKAAAHWPERAVNVRALRFPFRKDRARQTRSYGTVVIARTGSESRNS